MTSVNYFAAISDIEQQWHLEKFFMQVAEMFIPAQRVTPLDHDATHKVRAVTTDVQVFINY